MTFYKQELNRIRAIVFANQEQVDSVIAIRNFIETNYHNDLNLDLLASRHAISKFHLLRLFKRYYGLTPRQYLIDRRIGASKRLLSEGMSVTQCCFEVGFESLGSFSRLFKKKIGLSPSQFQKEQFSRNEIKS